MEYTATYRGNAANECILKRMATGASFSAHLFHGAPDIMIKAVPLVIDCECIIENKSATEGSYQSNSRLSNQSGQLVAYLHQLIVIKGIQMAIQMAIENTTSFPPLEAHGLYITSKKNPIVFSLRMSDKEMSITATYYLAYHQQPFALCRAVRYLILCNDS